MTVRHRTPVAPRRREIEYPDSDGKPMAENDLTRDEMVRLHHTLRAFFREHADVYVSANLLIYYEEGNRRASIAPDVFVVKGVPKLPRRRTFLLWREGVAPCFVIEITSRSTRREDAGKKRESYAQTGVHEYVMYDPAAEYLRPPLQGLRLRGGSYEPIPIDSDGGFRSEALGLRLVLADGWLQLSDPATGAVLLSPEERAEIEEARADAEATARRTAEARAAELEARLRQFEAERDE